MLLLLVMLPLYASRTVSVMVKAVLMLTLSAVAHSSSALSLLPAAVAVLGEIMLAWLVAVETGKREWAPYTDFGNSGLVAAVKGKGKAEGVGMTFSLVPYVAASFAVLAGALCA